MLSLPPLDLGAWSARAAVYEGYNDAFLPTSPSISPVSSPSAQTAPATTLQPTPRGSLLTGFDGNLQFSGTGKTTTHSLLLAGRAFEYTPSSPFRPATGTSALLAYGAALTLSPVTTITLGQSALWGDQDAMHAANVPLTALDLAQGRRQFAMSSTSMNWTHELTGADRERATASVTFQDTTRDESLIAPHTGLEYAAANLSPGYAHDFSGKDTGDFTMNFQWFYMPAAILDLSGNRGKSIALQVEPRATWVRTSSEQFTRSLFAGISFANTTLRATRSFFVTPTAGAQITYTRERFTAGAGYNLGFAPLSALSLPGVSNSVTGRIAGEPWQSGFTAHWVFLGTVLGGIGYLPTGNGSMIQTSVGAGFTALVPFARLLGVYVGYEGRLDQLSAGFGSAPAYQTYQNLAYLGVAGTLSSDPDAYGLPVPAIQR